MAVTPNYGWPIPVATDYVKDGWDAIADLGNAIDTTVAGLSQVDTVLASGTLTTSSALNLSNVLSNTYKFYEFFLYAKADSGTPNLNLRWRENTTDLASNYAVASQYVKVDNTTGNYGSSGSDTAMTVSKLYSNNSALTAKIYRPSATAALITWQSYDAYNNMTVTGAGNNTALTNFTGLSVYPLTSTFTGYYILTGIKA